MEEEESEEELQVEVHDLRGGHGTAEAEHGRCDDDGRRGPRRRDDGTLNRTNTFHQSDRAYRPIPLRLTLQPLAPLAKPRPPHTPTLAMNDFKWTISYKSFQMDYFKWTI